MFVCCLHHQDTATTSKVCDSAVSVIRESGVEMIVDFGVSLALGSTATPPSLAATHFLEGQKKRWNRGKRRPDERFRRRGSRRRRRRKKISICALLVGRTRTKMERRDGSRATIYDGFPHFIFYFFLSCCFDSLFIYFWLLISVLLFYLFLKRPGRADANYIGW